MLTKKITTTNFNGEEVTETAYFNLTKSELVEMDLMTEGGLKDKFTSIVETQDKKKIMETFKELIMRSYGEKSPDGKYLDKGEDMSLAKKFVHTAAYDALIMELLTNEEAASNFFLNVLPKDLIDKAKTEGLLTEDNKIVNAKN